MCVIGDFNAKVGKEDIYSGVIGKESLHEETSDNGERICNFAVANNLFICGTKFPHKDVHKGTWKVPGRIMCNQIDHILYSKRRLSNVQDVRVYRGANCDSDHFLLVATLKEKTCRIKNTSGERRKKWNTEKLEDDTTVDLYKKEIEKELKKTIPSDDIDEEWKNIKTSITTAAEVVLGRMKTTREEEWFDEEYRKALYEKNRARLAYLEEDNDTNRHLYTTERSKCRKMARKKKREIENPKISKIEDLRERNHVRHFFQRVNIMRKGYQPKTNACRNRDGGLLTEKEDIVERWREHFDNLLNVGDDDSDLLPTYYNVEEQLEPPTLLEIKAVLNQLKTNKAPGADAINSEMLKSGGPSLEDRLHHLVTTIWNVERMPEEWNLAIIAPIYKKGDKTECSNYRGISLLSVAYKVFSGVVYRRLRSYAEEILGEYQCGIRPNRSTIDQIHLMRQTMEKAYEFNINLHHLFVDYRQAFDSIRRKRTLLGMIELGIPSKLVRLVEAVLEHSKAVVAIQNEVSEPFEIHSGVKQGDALSSVVFNLAIEAIIRKLNIRGLIDYNTSQVAAYADDIVISSRSQNSMINHCSNLEAKSANYGLQINASKTKYLATTRLPEPANHIKIGDSDIEGVESFKYLGSMLTGQNEMDDEIKARIVSGNKCFYSCSEIFSSKLLSVSSKLTVYRTIIRPVVTYACETWTLTQRDEQRLAIFERKVLRRIF
ncbi:unnamed protein product [Euphydryas editha]|nr:unnamed protein product [Euphydryas editha]